MKYVFILGRNVQLSFAEVFAYFKKEENKILNHELIGNILSIELEKELIEKEIENFGGVVCIGKVSIESSSEELEEKLESKVLYFGEKNNINYAVWNFAEDFYQEVLGYLKQRFKKEKLKAVLKPLASNIKLQDGTDVQNLRSGRKVDEEFFIFQSENSGNLFFGKIEQKFNSEEIERRDMKKPVRREELAISPRLAKIMINLSGVKKNEKLLDAFCGIGVILQEALLQGINSIGIDVDMDAIEGAKQNFEWAGFKREDFRLINGDSRKERVGKVSVMVSEPDLGEKLRKIPSNQKIEEILTDFENLIIDVINNQKENVFGKIVFTTPYIKLFNKNRIGCDAEKITQETGMSLSEGFPIEEFRKNQIVGRQIFVLER